MKIAILGYGKMGKRIESLALDRGHEIVLKIGSRNSHDLNATNLAKADICIEFSTPETAFEHISAAIKSDTAVISGSTGWLDQMSDIESLVAKHNGSFLYASNFSLGVNALFAINSKLAKILAPNTAYISQIEEIHHTSKKDQPSGTAISLAEQIIDESQKRYIKWDLDPESNQEQSLAIKAKRLPEVPGTHIISYESDQDIISLKHQAKNRDGFAIGALIAAEYLIDKKGIHTMSQVLDI